MLSVTCRHCSVRGAVDNARSEGLRSWKGFRLFAFPANKEPNQLWNSIVNRYRWIPRAGFNVFLLGTEFSDNDRRTGDNKTRPKTGAGSSHGKWVQAPNRFVTGVTV